MKHARVIIVCAVLTIVISLPSLMTIPSVMPFLSADVRRASPRAVAMLRQQGVWLVNATLDHIERKHGGVCFLWNHAYRSRSMHEDSSIISTCIREEK